MNDISLKWDPVFFSADATIMNGDLSGDDLLGTAVIVSLFTWGRARPDDVLPDDSSGRMGWWGDNFAEFPGDKIGSRLWIYARSKLTPETILGIKDAVSEALQWMIEDKVAERIDVNAVRNGLDRLDLSVTIFQGNANKREIRFDSLWEKLRNG